MKAITIYHAALWLAIPVSCGVLLSYVNRWHAKLQKERMERTEIQREIGQLYFSYCKDHQRPPLKLGDLEPYAEKFPRGFDEIRSGRWVILWGTPSTYDRRRNKERLIGHENKSPDPGRDVIMGDGLITVEWYSQYLWREEGLEISEEIGDMYFAHLSDKGHPPTGLKDLEAYSERFPKGIQAIRSGRWIVLWNTLPTDNQNENDDLLLAYEKQTRIRIAFWVQTADQSVRLMDPAALNENQNIVSISHEIWRLYAECSKDRKTPPTKLEDLETHGQKYPRAFQAIRSGDWCVRWGTVISNDAKVDSKRILAYEKHVPTTSMIKGGFVIMADNSSCTMWSYDFERADR